LRKTVKDAYLIFTVLHLAGVYVVYKLLVVFYSLSVLMAIFQVNWG